jgi:hypothetical protein
MELTLIVLTLVTIGLSCLFFYLDSRLLVEQQLKSWQFKLAEALFTLAIAIGFVAVVMVIQNQL